MSLASLKGAVDRELALEALAGQQASFMEFVRLVPLHLDRKTPLRLGVDLLPTWWTRFRDASQVDGRVTLKTVDALHAAFQIYEGPTFSLSTHTFLRAILDGRVLEAQ